jgi:hypothetical protein
MEKHKIISSSTFYFKKRRTSCSPFVWRLKTNRKLSNENSKDFRRENRDVPYIIPNMWWYPCNFIELFDLMLHEKHKLNDILKMVRIDPWTHGLTQETFCPYRGCGFGSATMIFWLFPISFCIQQKE